MEQSTLEKAGEPNGFEKFVEDNPVFRFSIFTYQQAKTLREVASEIHALLDASINAGATDSVSLFRAHGLFWLWVLGAYEVVRTMAQGRDCFSETAAQRIVAYKGRLGALRMPFAKQEHARAVGGGPICGELSIYGINDNSRDFSHEVKGTVFSVRATLSEFDSFIESVTSADVLKDFRRSAFFHQAKPSRQA